jgi:hypothetical protein
MRLALLLLASVAAVAAFTANFLFNPLQLQPHRFTFAGRFVDFPDLKGPKLQPVTFTFFRDDPTSFDGDVRGALAAYNRQPHLHPLGRLGDEDRPYYTHPGYQAFLLAALARLIGGSPATAYSWGSILFAALAALTLTGLLFAVYREFGRVCCLLVFALLMLSDWLIFIGASVYWASFTIYLPMTVAWLVYPAFIRSKVRLLHMIVLLAVLVFVRCILGGYEFITNILLSFTVPVVYYRTKSGSALRPLAREIALLATGGAVGFVLAFAVHCFTLAQQLGLAKAAAARILQRVAQRTIGLSSGPLEIAQADRLPALVQYAPRDLVKAVAYLSNSIISVPFVRELHVLLAAAIILQVLVLVFGRRYLAQLKPANHAKMRALFFCLGWSFLCGCTWMFLMPGHMRPHVYFATIVFYVPWLLTLYVFCGAALAFHAGPLATALSSWSAERAKAVYGWR